MRSFRWCLAVLLLLTPVLVSTSATAQVDQPPPPAPSEAAEGRYVFPAPTNFLRRGEITNGGDSSDQVYTQDQAVALARRFDVIIGLASTFDDYLPAMKAANPRLKVLAYMNGGMAPAAQAVSMPDAWFAKDERGRRIRNLSFDLWYMDFGNTGWQDWVAKRCTQRIALSGYDGCYLDDLGVGNLGVNLSGWPIDPRTGRRITLFDTITYATRIIAETKRQNASHLVTSNGLNNGDRYFAAESKSFRILGVTDAGQAEGFLRGNYAPANKYRSEASWKRDIDMIVDAGNRGKTVLAGTKIWVPHTKAQSEAWRAYAYASFLLATNGNQFIWFSDTGPGQPDPPHPYENVNIGRPIEAYAKRNGVYQRRYTGGIAMVNPTTSTFTVPLDKTYTDLQGNRVTSVRLGPNSGQIVRSDTVPPPVTVLCNGKRATIVGTGGDDVLRGTAGNDIIAGLAGNDTIYAEAGNDLVCAGQGNDVVWLGAGDDVVIAGSGNDRVRGEAGNDKIGGGGGKDLLVGDDGNDKIAGGSGRDKCVGGPGADRMTSCEIRLP